MTVLVGYASAHGSTKGVAEAIAERVRLAGLAAEVLPIDEIAGLDAYEGIILGRAVHDQAWLPQGLAFLRAHAVELAARPVWLFSVSSVGDSSSFFGRRATRLFQRLKRVPEARRRIDQAIGPRGHRDFSGAIQRDHWTTSGSVFLRVFGGRYGDHRDWEGIARWADGIAAALRPRSDVVPMSTPPESEGDHRG